MSSFLLIGVTAAFLTMFGFVPQVIKMNRTRSVSDVSSLTLFQFTAGVSLWAVYGYGIQDPIVLGANLVSLATLLVALALYYHYRPPAQQGGS
jgi:MtN3 and saliva related transmembrane protein